MQGVKPGCRRGGPRSPLATDPRNINHTKSSDYADALSRTVTQSKSSWAYLYAS
jgi:hypothetical protein